MIAIEPDVEENQVPGASARRRFIASEGRPLLVADWERALFMHFEVPREVLQRHVPFELDLFEGRAFVSLVAVTMCVPFAKPAGANYSPGVKGIWLGRPIALRNRN